MQQFDAFERFTLWQFVSSWQIHVQWLLTWCSQEGSLDVELIECQIFQMVRMTLNLDIGSNVSP